MKISSYFPPPRDEAEEERMQILLPVIVPDIVHWVLLQSIEIHPCLSVFLKLTAVVRRRRLCSGRRSA